MRVRLWWGVFVLVTRVAPALGVLAVGLVYSFAFFGYNQSDFRTAAIAFAIPAAGIGILVWIASRRFASFTAPPIVFEQLEAQPQLYAELKRVAEEFRSRLPRGLAPMISTQHQALALDPERNRDLPVPLALLGSLSVLELRCHAAHYLIRRRPSFQKIEAQFAFANATISGAGPRIQKILAHVGRRCSEAAQSWHSRSSRSLIRAPITDSRLSPVRFISRWTSATNRSRVMGIGIVCSTRAIRL